VVRMKEPKGQHSAGFRPELGAGKRMSRMGRLAEGEELWSNILFRYFKELRSTRKFVDLAWRILRLALPVARARVPGPSRSLRVPLAAATNGQPINIPGLQIVNLA
jgi:hypothetical protein